MHVKFLAHGTGSGARASAYLLGAHDHTGAERAGVTVLRGDSGAVRGGGRLTAVPAAVLQRGDFVGR